MKMKAPLIVLCALLLVVASVMGTLAFLTYTTEAVVNTFSVGNVTIDLDEAKVDVYGEEVEGEARVKANEYKLIPGHEYTKDPIVHVTKGSEPCWLFVKVVNPIAAIEDETTIADQMAVNDWLPLTGVTGVYYYKEVVDASEAQVDKDVFANFKIKGDANVAAYADAQITVQAYAVQADGFGSAAVAWENAPCTAWTTPAA